MKCAYALTQCHLTSLCTIHSPRVRAMGTGLIMPGQAHADMMLVGRLRKLPSRAEGLRSAHRRSRRSPAEDRASQSSQGDASGKHRAHSNHTDQPHGTNIPKVTYLYPCSLWNRAFSACEPCRERAGFTSHRREGFTWL